MLPHAPFHTLIIDSEKASCERLERMLSDLDLPCAVIGKITDHTRAIAMIDEVKPDLVFMEIDNPVHNGIALLRRSTADPFVIFTSTDNRFAVKAFEANNVVAYLVKPVTERGLRTAVDKLMRQLRPPSDQSSSPSHKAARSLLPFLPVKDGDSIKMLKKDSIVWIKAEGRYTIIMTPNRQYVSNYSITELEKRLDSPVFMRVHRSYIVNLNHVTQLRRVGLGKLKLIPDIPSTEDIVVSKNYYEDMRMRLDIA